MNDSDYTLNGAKVICSVAPETQVATVEYDGPDAHLCFVFNPDFPNDAKALFTALCMVQTILLIEDEEERS